MNFWEEVRSKVPFYHSAPNDARPPRQGLWLNKTTNNLEIWSFYREADPKRKGKMLTGYGRSGYTSLNSPNQTIEGWIRGVMAKFMKIHDPDEVPYWLLHGGRDPSKIDTEQVTIARAGGLHVVKH